MALNPTWFSGSPGRTRTANLVVTSAPEFLLGLDYLFTRPGCSGVGCRALPPDSVWSTSRSSSLCTFPEPYWFRAWLRVTILRLLRRAGFPEFTRFFNHDFSWKLQSGVNFTVTVRTKKILSSVLVSATVTHQFILLQPPALPIELPGSISFNFTC